jgi:hypothetical protein
MQLGTPIPADLTGYTKEQLHRLMETFLSEHKAIQDKEYAVKPTLDALHMIDKRKNLAAYDLVITEDSSLSWEEAKSMLSLAAKG